MYALPGKLGREGGVWTASQPISRKQPGDVRPLGCDKTKCYTIKGLVVLVWSPCRPEEHSPDSRAEHDQAGIP